MCLHGVDGEHGSEITLNFILYILRETVFPYINFDAN